MITNKELLKYCLENKATFLDDNYRIDKEFVIIPRTQDEENELTKASTKLINLFTTMSTLNKLNDTTKDDEIAQEIVKILKKVENIHFFPFNFYCQTQGIIFDVFLKLPFAEQKRLIKDYIKDRHEIYLEHGYTKTILQTTCDSYAHKRQGDTGTKKLREQTENHNIKHIDYKEKNYYLNPDKGDEKKFKTILKEKNITYPYYTKRNGKLPDLFIKINDNYVIVEHKHMSTYGGHQNNVIVEIKDFIDEVDENVYYVAYLDGIAFQKYLFTNFDPTGNNKLDLTNKNINEIFEKNKRSYMVNTIGFDKLLDELINNK